MDNCKDCNGSVYGCICHKVDVFFAKCKDIKRLDSKDSESISGVKDDQGRNKQ